jgi:hypothetical protein
MRRRLAASLVAVPLVLAACSESNRSKAEGAVEDWVQELGFTREQEECARGVVADLTDEQLDTIESDSDTLDDVNMSDPDALAGATEETQQFYADIAECFGTAATTG